MENGNSCIYWSILHQLVSFSDDNEPAKLTEEMRAE